MERMARARPEHYRPPTSVHTRAWRRIRAVVLYRDRYLCQLEYPGCLGVATHCDHVLPLRFGGDNSLANLRAACQSCNLRRGDGTQPVDGEPASAW
jgi:5-methylcytosine-specific restriction endonuclease McrA